MQDGVSAWEVKKALVKSLSLPCRAFSVISLGSPSKRQNRIEATPAISTLTVGPHPLFLGAQNTHLTDPWDKTPMSAGPDEYNTYTDGADSKDYNVFANGYKFPHY